MRLNLKKISAIATSALMIGMSMGVAAASVYPAPFVSGSTSDVAIVYGASANILDGVQAGDIQSDLSGRMGSGSSTSTSVSGEGVELYTGGTKLYIYDLLNKVKNVLTDTDLPVVLKDGSFSGNVNANYVQSVVIGAYPNITYAKQPTSSEDPTLGVKLSTNPSASPAFNMTITFSKTVNFSHADSEGEDLSLFGKTYTISSSTDGTNLVLLQSAEKLSLESGVPADATIAGVEYTIELVSASDSAATIKVTNKATGVSESKEINEAQSKKVNGITVAVTNADETNQKLSASVVAGSQKVTFTDNSYVKIGEEDTSILGTDVDFHGGTPGVGLSKITISVTADDSDEDAILKGGELLDPVFGAVKLGLSGFNIEEDSTLREDIKVANSGDDKMELTFTDKDGNTKTIRYAKFGTATNTSLYLDDDYHNISIREGEKMHRNDYVVLGNEDEGKIIRINTVSKSVSAGTTATGDSLIFSDVMSGTTYTATLTTNTSDLSSGTVTIGGKSYDVYVEGKGGLVTDAALYNVSINYPDSAANSMIIYPTIQTSRGAKIAFYEPINALPLWAGGGDAVSIEGPFGWSNSTNLTSIKFPNGADTYQALTIAAYNGTSVALDFTWNSVVKTLTGVGNLASQITCNITNGGFGYNVTYNDNTNSTDIRLSTATGASIELPAIMVFEEKDDNNVYEGLIITTEAGATSDDGIGVDDVERSWLDDAVFDAITLASNSKIEKEMDLWGTIVTVDKGDSDQAKATLSYPDEQVYVLAYVGDATSGVTGGSSGASKLGKVVVTDAEISSVKTKNLIVVGGSCVNSVAAKLVGSAACTADFTEATDVGAGQFLIQSFKDAYTTGKIALLVAGYEAADTVKAATYLQTKTVDTTAGKKYIGTDATTAALVTEETTA